MEKPMELLHRARVDVDTAFMIWKEIFLEIFEDEIKYAYAKGSAVKHWDGPIDYVPILSDIDIHVSVQEGIDLLRVKDEGIEMALNLPKMYEKRFINENPDYLHIPRSQIMLISQLKNSVNYVPPDYEKMKFLIGSKSKVKDYSIPSNDELRKIDRAKIIDEKAYLDRLPYSAFDRTGLDQWQLIRQMCWRVSPMPTRLLSQFVEQPFQLWNENRTNIVKLLLDQGYVRIADAYANYYTVGWDLYLRGFDDSKLYRDLVRYGYSVLSECYLEALKSAK